MNLHKVPGDGQAEAQSTMMPSRRTVGLAKAIKNVWQKLLARYPDQYLKHGSQPLFQLAKPSRKHVRHCQ